MFTLKKKTIIQAPLSQKNVKVISSKKPSQRRRNKVAVSASSSNAAINHCKRQSAARRTKSDCVVIDIDDVAPAAVAPASTSSGIVPDLVGVKPEDVWLCQPSVAHVISSFLYLLIMSSC